MVITYQGLESFRITQGDLAIALNPASSRAGADITLISSNAFATDGKGFVITGPGEYEVKDIGVKGFLSESNYEGIARYNTIYQINLEGMNLCFLGPLSNPELSDEAKESIEDVDVLFVPVGGEGVLEAAAAYKLAVSLEPSVIIPMHYTDKSLAQFIKEGGEEKSAPVDKLVLKKKDLEGKEGEIIVLKEE
ncbi:MAG: MBL fold metallo-hydrolase [Patescibacteria group bacterium]